MDTLVMLSLFVIVTECVATNLNVKVVIPNTTSPVGGSRALCLVVPSLEFFDETPRIDGSCVPCCLLECVALWCFRIIRAAMS